MQAFDLYGTLYDEYKLFQNLNSFRKTQIYKWEAKYTKQHNMAKGVCVCVCARAPAIIYVRVYMQWCIGKCYIPYETEIRNQS